MTSRVQSPESLALMASCKYTRFMETIRHADLKPFMNSPEAHCFFRPQPANHHSGLSQFTLTATRHSWAVVITAPDYMYLHMGRSVAAQCHHPLVSCNLGLIWVNSGLLKRVWSHRPGPFRTSRRLVWRCPPTLATEVCSGARASGLSRNTEVCSGASPCGR